MIPHLVQLPVMFAAIQRENIPNHVTMEFRGMVLGALLIANRNFLAGIAMEVQQHEMMFVLKYQTLPHKFNPNLQTRDKTSHCQSAGMAFLRTTSHVMIICLMLKDV